MKKHFKTWLFLLMLVSFSGVPTLTSAQEESKPATWRVETKDGNIYFGQIVSQTQDELRLKTESLGTITIPISEISVISDGKGKPAFNQSVVLENNFHLNRYFYSPNGYGLKKGEGYYQNVLIFFNQASYGFTDHFTMGVGVIPLFLFAGTSSPVWITPKFSIPIKENQVNLGVGGVLGTVIGEEVSFGLGYATLTLGSREKNLSFGLGYGFAEGEVSSTPLINIGGMVKVGRRGYLMGESYFVTAEGAGGGIIILGGRSAWENISLDYGGIIPVGDVGTLIVVPWLGVTIPLGK
jgi:hypothetical protein